MKRLITCITIICIVFTNNSYAQEQSKFKHFTLGSAHIDFGVGISEQIKYETNTFFLIPISSKFDIGIKDFGVAYGTLALGGMFGNKMNDIKGYSHVYFGPRLSYNYDALLKNYRLNLYLSTFVGSTIIFFGRNENIPYNVDFTYDFKIGARYRVAKLFGFYAELGYKLTIAEIGCFIRMK